MNFSFPFQLFLIVIIFLLSPVNSKTYIVEPEVGLYELIRSLEGPNKILPGTIFQYKSDQYGIQWQSNFSGNSTHHIKILGVEGIKVKPFSFTNISYVDFIGPFVVSGADKHGMWINQAEHLLIQNFHIHHTQINAIYTVGAHILIRDNYVHYCDMMNYENNNTEWGQGIRLGAPYEKGPEGMSTNITAINNTILDSWGEGMTLGTCKNCLAKKNTIRNCFSVLLYFVNSRESIAENNFLYVSSNSFNLEGRRATGIAIGLEDTKMNINATEIIIRNNWVVGTHHGVQRFSYSKEHAFFARVKITHNTFFNLSSLGMQFHSTECEEMVKDNEVSNNLFRRQL